MGLYSTGVTVNSGQAVAPGARPVILELAPSSSNVFGDADCAVHPFICQLAPRLTETASTPQSNNEKRDEGLELAAARSGLSARRIVASLAVASFEGARESGPHVPFCDRVGQSMNFQCFAPEEAELQQLPGQDRDDDVQQTSCWQVSPQSATRSSSSTVAASRITSA